MLEASLELARVIMATPSVFTANALSMALPGEILEVNHGLAIALSQQSRRSPEALAILEAAAKNTVYVPQIPESCRPADRPGRSALE